jgi:hypothetical protein
MASSLGVVVGDRGTDTTTRRLGGQHRVRGDPAGSRGAPLGWRATWAARPRSAVAAGRRFCRMGMPRPRSLQQGSAARPRGDPGGQQPDTSRESRWPGCSGQAVLEADMKEMLRLRQQGTLSATLWRPAGPTASRGAGGGERSWANPPSMRSTNNANDHYRAARRSTRRR